MRSEEAVIKAFQSSTFNDPKLSFGDALEILQRDHGLSEHDAALLLSPEMVEAQEIELWEVPNQEEE